MVFVNLPQVGDAVTAGEAFARCGVRQGRERRVQPRHRHCAAKSMKLCLTRPRASIEDPYGAWFIRVENVNGSVETLSAEEYEAMPKEG